MCEVSALCVVGSCVVGVVGVAVGVDAGDDAIVNIGYDVGVVTCYSVVGGVGVVDAVVDVGDIGGDVGVAGGCGDCVDGVG